MMVGSPAHSSALPEQLGGGRTLWVENAKAIGIVLVVYGHVMRGAMGAGLVVDTGRAKLIDSIVYTFHMPLFFFLSGLFFYDSLRKRGAARLACNKFDTLLYPYILWSLLQGVIEAGLSRWTNGHATLLSILEFAWAPRAQLWFLYALFLICVVGILVYRKATPRLFGAIAFVASLAFIVRNDDLGLPQIAYLLGFFCFFALGVWFNARQAGLFRVRWPALLPVIALFCAAQYLFHITWGLTYRDPGVPALLLAFISIGTVTLVSMCMTDRQPGWITKVGASSLVIYLCHIVVASGSRIILVKTLGITDLYVIVCVGCVVGIVLPLAFAKEAPRLKLDFLFAIPQQLSLERRYTRRSARTVAPQADAQRI